MDALTFHKQLKGKIEVISRAAIHSREDLSLAYTPGVAEPCTDIARDPEKVYAYTRKGNMVAVITDGSAVLGLGNIGPAASLPVMEGKAVLFKTFADVDAFPIALATQDTEEIIETIVRIAPMFGGINLEDISAPRCFEIEERLSQVLDIPVFHDDQHGTAIVLLAGLYNALRVVNKSLSEVNIVISGVGAAGVASAKLLLLAGATNMMLVDSLGIISSLRSDLNSEKQALAAVTNKENKQGTLADALVDADVFIGVSKGGIVSVDMVRQMRQDAIIFAMANPTPEIMPDLAKQAGAAVVATGRSDFPNQINNVLAFPGIFRGLLDARIRRVSDDMQLSVAQAIAALVETPRAEYIIPDVFDSRVVLAVADAIKKYA